MLPGHEDLKCSSCHKDEQGTLRQQLQAKIQYLLNNRKHSVSLGLKSVQNNECIECHDRPNDRHPVYRFREPKFRAVREKIQANTCVSCHQEHNNTRVSIQPVFCMYCHDELKLKNDPLDVSHHELIEQEKWGSCLTCHDYHGNHDMKVEINMKNSISTSVLKNYFKRGENPYPGNIIHKAKQRDE